jgi:hypothetical protein
VKLRAVATIALAASLAVGLSGCNFFSPQRTLEKYDPSDGVGANLGDVDIRNALLVTDDGERATLVVSIANLTDADKQLRIEYPSYGPEAVDGKVSFQLGVPATSLTTTSTDGGDQIILEDIDAPAGSLFSVYMQAGDAPGTELRVPVLDGTFPRYEPLLPSPSPTPTPTPTPTLTPTPIPTTTAGTEPEGTVTEGSAN